MLDFTGTIMTATAVSILLAAVVCAIPVTLTWKLAVAGAWGAWVGFAIAIAAAGKLADVGWLGVLFVSPLVATASLAFAFPAMRSVLLAIPAPLVIGLNFFRILTGMQFLLLASAGRLGGLFPSSAGWGDIIVGALAIPIAILASRVPTNDVRIVVWNVLGTLDLVSAAFLGIASANGSPLQLIHAGAGSAAMQTLPWSLVPTFLVPIYLIGHAIVFAHARAAAAQSSAPSGEPFEHAKGP